MVMSARERSEFITYEKERKFPYNVSSMTRQKINVCT